MIPCIIILTDSVIDMNVPKAQAAVSTMADYHNYGDRQPNEMSGNNRVPKVNHDERQARIHLLEQELDTLEKKIKVFGTRMQTCGKPLTVMLITWPNLNTISRARGV